MTKEHMMACGMHICGKCSKITMVFGILFLVLGFGLWSGAPGWWNLSTLIGAFFLLWGGGAMMKM